MKRILITDSFRRILKKHRKHFEEQDIGAGRTDTLK